MVSLCSSLPQDYRSMPVAVRWSPIKIERVCLRALAALSLVSSMALSLIGRASKESATGLAIPLVVVGGGLLYWAASLIDYEDPNTLAEVRSEALRLSFPQVIQKHGWSNLFRYEILSTNGLLCSLDSYANTVSFAQFMKLFHEGQIEYVRRSEATEAPLLVDMPYLMRWKEKFDRETAAMPCEQVLKQYPLEVLKMHRMLTERQAAALDDAVKSIQLFDEQLARRKGESDARIEKWEKAKNLKKAEIELRYTTHSAHHELAKLGVQLSQGRLGAHQAEMLETPLVRALQAAKSCRDLAMKEAKEECQDELDKERIAWAREYERIQADRIERLRICDEAFFAAIPVHIPVPLQRHPKGLN